MGYLVCIVIKGGSRGVSGGYLPPPEKNLKFNYFYNRGGPKPQKRVRLKIFKNMSVERFRDQLPYIYKALLEIEKFNDKKSASKAFKYRTRIESFDFICSLIFIAQIMKNLNPLATFLQGKSVDLHSALKKVEKYCSDIEQS